MGALVFPWLMRGITYKEAPSTSEVLKPISRTEGKKALFAKNKPLIYTNLHPTLYTLCIVYVHSISHWMLTPKAALGLLQAITKPTPTPAGSFLTKEMTHIPPPLGESPEME